MKRLRKLLRKLKRKLLCLIERIKLSELDYLNMKSRSQMYNDMMSTVEFDSKVEYDNIEDAHTNPILFIPKKKITTLNVDIEKMLAAGGIVFDKNAVTLNITGY